MYFTRSRVTLTTDGTSGSTGVTSNMGGELRTVVYHPGASGSAFTTTARLVVTIEDTSEVVVNTILASSLRTEFYPRQQTHTTTGGTIAYSTAATPATVFERFAVADSRFLISVSSGGASKTGSIDVIVG